ncbi:hypothetical protein Tco_0427902 [Tanacetum coccineum]
MSNTNTNLQTQTSNALHNAIMEAGGKDRPPMLAPGNYNPPYKFNWTEKTVPVAEGSSETTTEGYMENYKNVLQDIRDQLNAEVVQIILTGIDNDIYSTVDACLNACEIRANQDNSPRINRGHEYDNQRVVNVAGARENVGTQLNAEQADWRDDTEDEPGDQELEAHYMCMAEIQEVTPDDADNSGPIFDVEPLQKVQNDDDNYNVFDNDREHLEQPESDDDDLAKERDLLASLIEKLKCEIDDSKNRNKFLESSNKALVYKMKDLKKFQTELDRYHDVNYASNVAINCAKVKGDLMSYKMESEKSYNEYTRKINYLNQTISDMKKELFAHQETISIMPQEKEAQTKFHKTRDDTELEKIIALENKIKVLDDIIYKTG